MLFCRRHYNILSRTVHMSCWRQYQIRTSLRLPQSPQILPPYPICPDRCQFVLIVPPNNGCLWMLLPWFDYTVKLVSIRCLFSLSNHRFRLGNCIEHPRCNMLPLCIVSDLYICPRCRRSLWYNIRQIHWNNLLTLLSC